MYLDYYRLTKKPFQISTDPKFLWLSNQHQEALSVLQYGILDNKGFLLLTGDVGTGKTTLLNTLISSLGEDVFVAMVTDPGLAKMDFFNFVANLFGIKTTFKSKGEFLIYLKNFLLSLHDENKQALLIIDEAQHLSQKMLEEVRLLSNIEKHDTKLINIFFVGQSEFNKIILNPRNRAIRQRITINYNIVPLSEADTQKYIRFRLKVAGGDGSLFTSRAVKEVFKYTNGYPRLINIICDQALLTGYVNEKTKIDEKIVAECAEELKISNDVPIRKSKATLESGQIYAEPESHEEPPAQQPVLPAAVPTQPKPSVFHRFLDRFRKTAAKSRDGSRGRSRSGRRSRRKMMIGGGIVILVALIGGYLLLSGQIPGVSQKKKLFPPEGSAVERNGGPVQPPEGSPHKGPEASSHPSEPPEPAGTGHATSDPENSQNGKTPQERITLDQITNLYGTNPTVYFRYNANTLEDDAYPLLQTIAAYCVQHPETQLILRGYSDRSGPVSYNIKLSEFRSDIVKVYLIGRGVDSARIETHAIGQDPKNSKASERKVTIEIIP